MKLARFLISKPVSISIVILFLCILGVAAYLRLPVSDLPTKDYPVVTVSAFYPGADPQTMADAIAVPLEKQLIGIQGLNNIISTSSDSFTSIILTFDMDCKLETVIPDIQTAISYAKGYMPKLPDDPSFSKTNPSEKPIMYLIADSETIPHNNLFQLSDLKISQPLSMTEGISSISIWSVSSAIRIYLDPHLMAQYGITFSDISYAIYNASQLSSGGFLSGKERTYSIITDGQLTTPEGYNNLIIKYTDNNPVRISDIGRALYTPQQLNYMLKYYDNMRKEALTNPVMLSISRKDGSNTVALIDKIKDKLKSFKASLPEAFDLSIAYDRSDSIIRSLFEMKLTLVVVAILVIFIVYIFLGKLSATFIPGAIIPVTILITFVVMYLLNYSIDNLSLLALILAVGFIVDDSIVVLENTNRHIENGTSPIEASLKSSREISSSVIFMTLSLAAVFIPILFLGGSIGSVFSEFAVTAIVMILISGILSLTMTPMMCANILTPLNKSGRSFIQKRVSILLKSILRKYSQLLNIFLGKPSIALLLFTVCTGLSVIFYIMTPKGFIPPGDSGTVFGAIKLPLGVSSDIAQNFQNEVDEILKADSNIAKFISITGVYMGADQSTGLLTIMLKERKERESMSMTLAGLREKFKNMRNRTGSVYLDPVPELDINTGGQTTAKGNMYSYLVTGLNSEQVFQAGLQLEREMKNSSLFTDVQSDIKLNMPQVTIRINRDKAYSLGISVADIESALLYAYSQGRVGQYIEDSTYYDVIIQLEDKYTREPEDISSLYIRLSSTAQMVPISSIVEFIKTTGPQTITHYQQMPAATISFNLASSVPMGTAIDAIEAIASDIFPGGVSGKLQGDAREFAQSIQNLLFLIGLAIILIYAALGLLYESYIYPLAVITTIPAALAGGLGSLLLFDSQLNLFAYVGLFLLCGIVVKNGIMIVNFAIQKINIDKMSPKEAVFRASLIRFRPILMTGLTSLFGAIPLVFGLGYDQTLRRPLGLVIIGGLIAAQFLTLIITPGIFLYTHKVQTRILDRFNMTSSKVKLK